MYLLEYSLENERSVGTLKEMDLYIDFRGGEMSALGILATVCSKFSMHARG